jgi:hypothetical protein
VLTSGGPAVNFLDHVSMPPLLLSYAGPAVNRASISEGIQPNIQFLS